MTDRYQDIDVLENKEDVYEKLRKSRGVSLINHYETPYFLELTQEQIDQIEFIQHTWTIGDRFYKLAEKHYGLTSLWWVIARFNGVPTESHLSIGDVIQIPSSLEVIMDVYSRQGVA